MIYIAIRSGNRDTEEIEARLLAGPTIGLEQRDAETIAYYSDGSDARQAALALVDLDPRLVEAPDQNWQAEWQSKWRPLLIGERFFLVPEWDTTPTPGDRVRLEMHSGMAFGSGDHATTQLGLLALEEKLQPGGRVLDLGAGSGILLIAAMRLGAALAAGTEIDRVAIGLARKRLLSEGFQADLVCTDACGFRDESFDLVVANISPRAAVELSDAVFRLLRPGGTAFVGGFTDEEEVEVVGHYERLGCDVGDVRRRREWRMLAVKRS